MKIEVIDFYASWCGPCKMLSPIIDQLISSYSLDETVEIKKLDIEENVDLATQYSIKTVPTILFLKDGELSDKINGTTSKQKIIEKIESLKQ